MAVTTTIGVGADLMRVRATVPRDAASRPFVLLHGVGMSHRSLARLHDELARTGPAYSIDLPGFGGLPKPADDLDVHAMAVRLAMAFDALGLADAIVIGHSMGTQWAVELGVIRPDLVHGVVAIGPVVDDRHRSFGAQLSALAVDSLGEPPNVNAIVVTDYLRCGARWYLRQARQMLRYRMEDRVAALTVPLLVVRGRHDPIAGPDWSRRLRDLATEGSLVVIPRSRHVALYTAPRAVAAAVLAWSDRVGACRLDAAGPGPDDR